MRKEIFDLSKFNEYREGNRLEVKKANGGLPNSLWDTYSSFSNCNGGAIILGVKEQKDGSWVTTHLQNRNKLLKDFWDTINNRSKVSVNLLNEDDVQTYDVGDDVVIVIYVSKADRVYKPVYINNDIFGGTFRRDHEGDYHCSESEVRGMLRDQAEKSMDSKILTGLDMNIFYKETVKAFRTRHNAVNPEHVWHRLEDEGYLERIGAASVSDIDGKLHPTVAGLLMFGEEYKIRQIFPEYFLDYREMLDPAIRWTDRIESSSGEWSGNLMDFFFQMEKKLLRDLKKPFKLEGITRIDETPVHKAVREALANCIANADFNFSRGIVIKKDAESIVIENPGSVITGLPQMIKGGISEPRNKAIMKMFNLIRVGERAGSGVPDILCTWNDEGWISPVIEEQYHPDRTVLTLSFKEKQAANEEKTKAGSSKQAANDEKSQTEPLKQAANEEKSVTESAKQAANDEKSETEPLKQAANEEKSVTESPKQAANEKKPVIESPKQAEKVSEKTEQKKIVYKTIDNKNKIIQYIENHGQSGIADISNHIGLSKARTRVLMNELITEGKIISEGESRATGYRIKQ